MDGKTNSTKENILNNEAFVEFRKDWTSSKSGPSYEIVDKQTEGSDKIEGTGATPNDNQYLSIDESGHRLGQRQFSKGHKDSLSSNLVRGLDHLKDAQLNKDLAFTLRERQTLGIHGLLPPRIYSQEEQLNLCRLNIERYKDNLDKYVYLMDLQDRNEKLFYRFLSENVETLMPVVYTPTVGLACQKYGLIYRRPKGLYISIHDKGHIYDVLKNWPESDVRAIVVTDGERILGLGDLGAYGMGIPVGKLALYTALAGIKPQHCLPITLDVGTNTQDILDDPLYIGLRQKRITGELYDDFVDEFMRAVVRRYGQSTLIQFEDFANTNSFRLLDTYRDKYCTFNDDIQGTASVALAGILASLKITNTKLSENTILLLGAGGASLGIAELCVMAMRAEGISEEDARAKIWLVDSKGLIVNDRPEGGITGQKSKFAQSHQPIQDLSEAVKSIKPNILIGASAMSGAFTPEIIQTMAANNKHPIIFALSNPTCKAECTAEQAYRYTDGRAFFASGSPFGTVSFKDCQYKPGQGNNAYIFPGVSLGVICAGIRHISDEIFLIAASALAEAVSDDDLKKGSLYPPLSNIKIISIKIATKIMEYAYQKGIAFTYPEPADKEGFVRNQLYDTTYSSSTHTVFPWPEN
ncbi:NADP-dependent malic enzyme-like [Macrosteles quadrilineatus]|uniref:NADP-dependent malic enzyme-like n=1 Tax=Macrosteles quadrilineatus TaxID=74068 RepID=UPI0023E11CB3|nr:NADP-dependent malic enzyme-like [Macrosteles quadrilineatus]